MSQNADLWLCGAPYLQPKGAHSKSKTPRPLWGHTYPKGDSETESMSHRMSAQLQPQGSHVKGRRSGFRGKLVFSRSSLSPWCFFFLTVFISFCRINSHQKDEPETRLSQ